MNAPDVLPTRLERARYKITDLLAKRAEGQTALLAYAGDAFAVTPLTDDVATIDSQLSALTTDIMPVQGSHTGPAIAMAVELLKKGGAPKGDILLITDEVDLDAATLEARKAASSGYRVSVLGSGTPEGAPIPKPDGGFMTDENGEIVVPRLDEASLQQLASAGGGRYLQIAQDDSDVDALDGFFVSATDETDIQSTEFETDVWREQGPWLLLALIPIAAFAFRRGYLLILVMACRGRVQPRRLTGTACGCARINRRHVRWKRVMQRGRLNCSMIRPGKGRHNTRRASTTRRRRRLKGWNRLRIITISAIRWHARVSMILR